MDKSTLKNSFVCKLYILIYMIIMFSGSTFLSDYVMPLAVVLIGILACGAKLKGVDKIAFTSNKDRILKFIFLLIILFLIYQLTFTYDFNTTLVFLERFMIYFLYLIFIPKIIVNYKLLKSMKIYSIIVAISILIMVIINGEKSGGLVGNYQFAGMMMSISFGLILIDYYFEKGNFNTFALILTFLALLSSGKRMFSFLALLSYIIIYLFSIDSSKRKKFLGLTILVIISVIISYIFIPSVRLVVQRVAEYSNDTTYNGRSYFWDAALDIYNNHKLKGIGMGTFSKNFDVYYHRLGNMEAFDAHNIYIQMLAEIGIVGELLFISFFIISLIKTLKLYKKIKEKKEKEKLYVLCYSLYLQLWFIIYGFTGNPLYGASQFFFYITAVAMMISVKNDNLKINKKKVVQNEIM